MRIISFLIFCAISHQLNGQTNYLQNHQTQQAYFTAGTNYIAFNSTTIGPDVTSVRNIISHRKGAIREVKLSGNRDEVNFTIRLIKISNAGISTPINVLFNDIALAPGIIHETTNVNGGGNNSPYHFEKGEVIAFEITQTGSLPLGEFGLYQVSYTVEWNFEGSLLSAIPTFGNWAIIILVLLLLSIGAVVGQQYERKQIQLNAPLEKIEAE